MTLFDKLRFLDVSLAGIFLSAGFTRPNSLRRRAVLTTCVACHPWFFASKGDAIFRFQHFHFTVCGFS
jgi:hypothetical protein